MLINFLNFPHVFLWKRDGQDLRAIDVDVVTFGQYLRPTEKHLSVVEYVKPEKFDYFRKMGEDMGFKYVASGPMVRSSYKAGEFYLEHMIRSERKGQEELAWKAGEKKGNDAIDYDEFNENSATAWCRVKYEKLGKARREQALKFELRRV